MGSRRAGRSVSTACGLRMDVHVMCSDRTMLFILNVMLDDGVGSLLTLCVFLIKLNLAHPETLLFLTGSIWRHLSPFVVSEKKRKSKVN